MCVCTYNNIYTHIHSDHDAVVDLRGGVRTGLLAAAHLVPKAADPLARPLGALCS
jgi:hypothetical protein